MLAALEVPLGVQYARNERRDLEAKVERDATVLASVAEDALRSRDAPQLGAVAARSRTATRRDTGGRVVVVDRARRRRRRHRARPAPASRASPRGPRSRRRCAAASPRGRGTRRRSARTCSTSPCRSPPAARSTARCGSRTRPRRVDARVRRYWLMLARDRGRRARGRRARRDRGSRAFVARPLRGSRARPPRSARATSTHARPSTTGRRRCARSRAVFNETVAKLEQLLRSQERVRRRRVAPAADAADRAAPPAREPRARRRADGRASSRRRREVERLGELVEACSCSRAPTPARRPPERSTSSDARARARRRVVAARRGARTSRLRPTLDGAPPRARRAGAARQVLDNLIENALEALAGGGTVDRRASRRAAVGRAARARRGPGLDAEAARAGVRPLLARPRRRGRRASGSRSCGGSSRPTAARSSSRRARRRTRRRRAPAARLTLDRAKRVVRAPRIALRGALGLRDDFHQ